MSHKHNDIKQTILGNIDSGQVKLVVILVIRKIGILGRREPLSFHLLYLYLISLYYDANTQWSHADNTIKQKNFLINFFCVQTLDSPVSELMMSLRPDASAGLTYFSPY